MPLLDTTIYFINHCESSQLDLQGCLSDEDTDEFVDLLKTKRHIIDLQLQQNNLSDESIFKLIKNLPWIEQYNFKSNNISDRGAIALATCANVKRLDLSNNGLITPRALEEIAEKTLQTAIGLGGNNITADLITKIQKQTSENKIKEQKVSANSTEETIKKITPSGSLKSQSISFWRKSESQKSDIGDNSDSESLIIHQDPSVSTNESDGNKNRG